MIANTETLRRFSLGSLARDIKKDDEPRVSAKWTEMYNVALNAWLLANPGKTQRDLGLEVGAPESQVSRLRGGKWTRYANALADFLTLPRPYVLVSSSEEGQWIDIGRRIHEADPERFRRLLIRLGMQADLVERIREQDQAIAEIAPDPVSEGDDTT